MVPLQSFASESTFRFSLPTHTSEHSYYSRLPLPMWRVHLKDLGAMHILSHSPQPADLTLAAGCTRDDFSLRRSLVSSLLSPGCGNLQVLVWEIFFSSPAAKPRVPSPQWLAVYSNLPVSSAFHLALAKASGFTTADISESLHIPNAGLP